jgi:hypothetical protein
MTLYFWMWKLLAHLITLRQLCSGSQVPSRDGLNGAIFKADPVSVPPIEDQIIAPFDSVPTRTQQEECRLVNLTAPKTARRQALPTGWGCVPAAREVGA